MARTIDLPLDEILDLVNCAHSYGFSDDVLLSAFAEWTGWVSNDEIEEYAKRYLTDALKEQGYTREDYTEAKQRLKEWRKRYCKRGKKGGKGEGSND